LPFAAITSLNWDDKCRFDRNPYLIKSLDFTLTPTGVSVCKAELYTML
jgi:hypothetical protein